MYEFSDFEAQHIASGDLILKCVTQLILQKGTSGTRFLCSHPLLWSMISLYIQDTLALEFLLVADIKRPLFLFIE